MNRPNIGPWVSALIGITLISLGAGCTRSEKVTTYDMTKSGKNWAESESVQRRTGPDGKTSIEKQTVYEKVKCIGPKNKKTPANTPDECIRKGGKIVDEMIIEEESIRPR